MEGFSSPCVLLFSRPRSSAGSSIDLDEQGAEGNSHTARPRSFTFKFGGLSTPADYQRSISWHNRAFPVNDSKRLKNC